MIKTKSSRPLIGVIPDYREGSPIGYSLRDYYALGTNYINMINKSGGAAVILTYDYDLIDSYLESLDGIMVVGGYFDINPKRYGEEKIHPTIRLNHTRENFEHEFGVKAMKTNIPFLGICNGMQLLNVIHGGKVIPHIPDNPDLMDHEQNNVHGFKDYHTPYHEVTIAKDSRLSEIAGATVIKTNSSHHQAAKTTGDGLRICAQASDGVIEAIEKPGHPFCLGVQWHPEFNTSIADKKIFEAFVTAAKQHKTK